MSCRQRNGKTVHPFTEFVCPGFRDERQLVDLESTEKYERPAKWLIQQVEMTVKAAERCFGALLGHLFPPILLWSFWQAMYSRKQKYDGCVKFVWFCFAALNCMQACTDICTGVCRQTCAFSTLATGAHMYASFNWKILPLWLMCFTDDTDVVCWQS